MARIAYFVHGRGHGHAIRAQAVLSRLADERHELFVFGGGASVSLLGHRSDFVEVEPCIPGAELLAAVVRRLQHDVPRLRRLRPDVLITDGDFAAAHAALRLNVPSIALGHGLLYGRCRLPAHLPLRWRFREALKAASSSWPCWRHVVVHFAPVHPLTSHTRVARPDLRQGLIPSRQEDFVLAYFRDDNGGAVLRQLVERGHRVVYFGQSSESPAEVTQHPISAEAFAEALSRCRFVVGSAGNHLPAECAMLEKPMLAVYRPGDVEHQMNAMLVEAAGIGLASSVDGVTVEMLNHIDSRCEQSMARAAAKIRKMPPVSEVVVRLVRELTGGSSPKFKWLLPIRDCLGTINPEAR